MCFLVVIGVIFPRFLMVLLWLFSDWFKGVFDLWIWPVLGFLFLPYTTLWYTAVVNWYGGRWDAFQMIVLLIAIIFDLGLSGSTARGRK